MRICNSIAAAVFALAVTAQGGAYASTVTDSFTDLQGDTVTWTATVDTGIALSQQSCCTLPSNQGDGTVLHFVNAAFGTSYSANDGKQDLSSGFSVDWSGSPADAFAIHFGGAGGGNELLILLSANTRTFDFSMSGTRSALSSLQGFAGPTATPLPAALPLFAGGLACVGFLMSRKKRAQATDA